MMGNPMMGFGSIWMFLVPIALVIATVLIVRLLFPQNTNDSALDIARKRLAKGEISREEYERLSHDLS